MKVRSFCHARGRLFLVVLGDVSLGVYFSPPEIVFQGPRYVYTVKGLRIKRYE